MDRRRFLGIVIGYRNELRLWVMGERPWEHCVTGLAGRVVRRLTALPERRTVMGNGRNTHWRRALERAGVDPDADATTLRVTIEKLGLLYDVAASGAGGSNGRADECSYAIVWAGGRPRDPEVCFAEARSDASSARALAEALGRFLVRDPGYPVR
jgi:hypothetical protein